MGREVAPVGVTVCSGCVGTTLGSADPLRGGQHRRWEELEERGSIRLSEVDCLDVCTTDVAVVRPTREGRRCGGRPFWMQGVVGDEVTDAVEQWCVDGGPGVAPTPPTLLGHHVTPPAD